jgi:hypothetical protein
MSIRVKILSLFSPPILGAQHGLAIRHRLRHRCLHSQVASIESGAFNGLTKLTELSLFLNQLSSLESGAFSRLTDLESLSLSGNTALTELNLGEADFSSLVQFGVRGNVNITSVSLRNTVVNQTSLARLLVGGGSDPSSTRALVNSTASPKWTSAASTSSTSPTCHRST